MRLQQIGALRELLVDHVAQRDQPAALEQLVGQRHRVADARAQHRDRDPDTEHAEPVQQRRAGRRVHRQFAVLPDEAVHRQHRLGELGGVDAGQLLQRHELALPQRAGGQRQQPGHRDDGLTDARLVHFGGEPLGHVLGRQHRVDAARTDLVGPRRHPDDSQRARRSADELADLLEQRDIGRVQCAQQEHHRVDARHAVLGDEQPQGPLRDVTRQRRRARGVDDRGVDQLGGGPLHVEVDDVLGIEAGEVERQTRPLRAIGTLDRRPPRWLARDLGVGPLRNQVTMRVASVASVGAMSSPTSAFTKRRLAGLERARQRDADGLVQSPADPLELVVHVGTLAVRRIGPVGLDGAAQDRAHLIARAHVQRAAYSPLRIARQRFPQAGLARIAAQLAMRVVGDLAAGC